MAFENGGMSPADIAAVTGNCGCNGNGNSGNGNGLFGDGAWWIIILFLFVFMGWGGMGNRGGFGMGGGSGSGGGAADNYVLASDFATVQRQLADGFAGVERRTDTIINGICDLGYTNQGLINGVNQNVSNSAYNTLTAINTNGYENRLASQNLGAQLASCCCEIREGIADGRTQGVMNTNAIQNQLAMCCCENEKLTMQNRYEAAKENCETLKAIDKVGDRIIDYLAADKAQALRDENQALRLAASQQAQNAYLISQLGQKCPEPAYIVQPPQQVTFPTNCCGGVNFASVGGCGCGGTF